MNDGIFPNYQTLQCEPTHLGHPACLNCYDIDFNAFFGLSPDHPPVPSILVRDAIRNGDACSFCSLLVRLARQVTHPNEIVTYRGWESNDIQQLAFYFQRVYREPRVGIPGGGVMRVRIYPPPSPLGEDNVLLLLCPIFMDQMESLRHSARFVNEDRIDLDVCRLWLRDCEVQHPEICQRQSAAVASRFPDGFRVIDVVDKCVTKQIHTCRYVALSYVWGQAKSLQLSLSNKDELEKPQSLSKGKYKSLIAKTILDAMKVVKRIGERFLWVDNLCISQDGPDSDPYIACMDAIYNNAVLTIIAANGTDANAGLAGLRPGTRKLDQVTQEVTSDLLLTASLTAPDDMADSPWASRAWTFQEQLLSRRLLIFRGGQVVWQCPSCHMHEDTIAENKPIPMRRLRQIPFREHDENSQLYPPLQPLTPGPLRRTPEFTEYASIVTEFTKRRLTYDHDILRAFKGFSSVLERRFSSRFIYGLPETYLDVALLWIPLTTLKKRPGSGNLFPSWSWAGWIGQVGFEDTEDSKLEKIVPLVKWYIKHGNQEAMPINDVGIGIDESSLPRGKSQNTCMWFPTFELQTGRPDYVPTTTTSRGDKNCYLQFWTSCAFFQIARKQGSNAENNIMDRSLIKPIKAHIQTSGGRPVGYVILSGSGPLETDVHRHEFVVVSEALASGFDFITWTTQFSEQCLMYNVLLVEWDIGRHVAYRVGIGRVLKDAWQKARPDMKFIRLG